MKKTLEQLSNELDANIPRSAVKTREGAGRRAFSYLSTDYVIDRLNKVVGQLNWSSATEENRSVFEGQVNGKHCVSYIARVRIEVQHIDESGRILRTSHTGTGYGDGSDASNLGKAHELAAKEAESDALKRAAKNLGQSMGLALYDKDQTNVEDDAPAGKPTPVSTPINTPTKARPAQESATASAAAERPKAQAPHADRPAATNAHADRDKLMRSITAASKIILAQGKGDTEGLKANMREKYGTDVKENLTDEQAKQLLAELTAKAS